MNTKNVLEYGPRDIAPIRYMALAVAIAAFSCGEDSGDENSTQPQAEWSEYEEVISEVVEGATIELELEAGSGLEHQWEIVSETIELTVTLCDGEPLADGVTEYETGPTDESKCIELEADEVSQDGQWWLRVNERSRPL